MIRAPQNYDSVSRCHTPAVATTLSLCSHDHFLVLWAFVTGEGDSESSEFLHRSTGHTISLARFGIVCGLKEYDDPSSFFLL